MACRSEQDFEQYVQGVAFPSTKDELVSTTKSNEAPQHLIEHLEGLREGARYRDINELSEAEGYEEQATEQRES